MAYSPAVLQLDPEKEGIGASMEAEAMARLTDSLNVGVKGEAELKPDGMVDGVVELYAVAVEDCFGNGVFGSSDVRLDNTLVADNELAGTFVAGIGGPPASAGVTDQNLQFLANNTNLNLATTSCDSFGHALNYEGTIFPGGTPPATNLEIDPLLRPGLVEAGPGPGSPPGPGPPPPTSPP